MKFGSLLYYMPLIVRFCSGVLSIYLRTWFSKLALYKPPPNSPDFIVECPFKSIIFKKFEENLEFYCDFTDFLLVISLFHPSPSSLGSYENLSLETSVENHELIIRIILKWAKSVWVCVGGGDLELKCSTLQFIVQWYCCKYHQ